MDDNKISVIIMNCVNCQKQNKLLVTLEDKRRETFFTCCGCGNKLYRYRKKKTVFIYDYDFKKMPRLYSANI